MTPRETVKKDWVWCGGGFLGSPFVWTWGIQNVDNIIICLSLLAPIKAATVTVASFTSPGQTTEAT